MKIVQYPHPTLRYRSKPVTRVDRELKAIVREMFELMYDARGIGLAANQVDLPLQLFILNLTADPNDGEELVFINPVLRSPKGVSEEEEGCLSIVDLRANVARPEQIHVEAYDLQGNKIEQTVRGLLARAVQHEFDHLNGVLFTDRVAESARRDVDAELDEFVLEFESHRRTGEIPDDDTILNHLREVEQRYCQ